MLSVVVFDALWKEEGNISDILQYAYKKQSLPIKRLAVFKRLSSLLETGDGHISRCNVFIASFAELLDEYIDFARSLRRRKEHVFIVFAVDKQVDISSCVRPSVRPSGIMFIPLEGETVCRTIREIYAEYLRMKDKEEQPVFTIKSGGEYFALSTEDLLFFEAQGKKIAVKTPGQEILFYSNFESVLEQLPGWFIRCHKGYVVNTRQISRASFTNMTLTLKDNSEIPISRKYRDDVRAFVEGQEAELFRNVFSYSEG